MMRDVLMKRLIRADNNISPYSVGDRVSYDANIRGVTPRLGEGEIVKVSRGYATSGHSTSWEYSIKEDDGHIWVADELMIIDKL